MYIKDLLCELQYQVAVENEKKKKKKKRKQQERKQVGKRQKVQLCKKFPIKFHRALVSIIIFCHIIALYTLNGSRDTCLAVFNFLHLHSFPICSIT